MRTPAVRTGHRLLRGVAAISIATLGLAPARSASARAESADLALTGVSATLSDLSPSVVRTAWQISNSGPSDANGLLLMVTLPAGTTLISAHIATRPVCTLEAASRRVSCPLDGAFLAGGGTTAEVNFLNVSNPAGSTLDIHGTLTSGTTDPDQANNSKSVSIAVTGAPVPTVSDGVSAELVLKAKPLTTDSFVPEGTVKVFWDVLNAGPAAADRTVFVVELPEGVTAVSGNVSTNPCDAFDAVGHRLTCPWPGTLSADIQLAVFVSFSTSGLEPGATVTLLARVTSETTDPDLTDNESVVTFTVGGPIPHTGNSSTLLVWSALVLATGVAATLVARRPTSRRRT